MTYKERRYNEIVKKAELLYKAAELISGCNVIIKILFPELKESKDERIRKELINYLDNFTNGEDKELVDKFITWLERQVEKETQSRWKPSDEQIRILELAINYWKPNDVSVTTPLYNLLEQLKKLREE